MTFEFLIACRLTPGTDIEQVLTGLLFSALEDNQNDFDEGIVADMVQLRHECIGGEVLVADDVSGYHTLVGFAIELPDETDLKSRVIDTFAKSLPETPPIFHAVKFEDPLLRDELAERAIEIFALEMKLRRVLTVIYLHAYQGVDPFDLLQDEVEQPREPPKQDQMQAAIENQFFHLQFSQYTNLNRRRQVRQAADILDLVRKSEQYEALRVELLRVPVEHKGDADFLANLKSLMNSIDGMRNCVAHNRRPTRSVADNYPNARARLEERLDGYLASLASPGNSDG